MVSRAQCYRPLVSAPSQVLPAKVILSGAAIDTVAAVNIPANPSVTGTMKERMSLIRVLGGKPDSLELVVNLAEIVPWILTISIEWKARPAGEVHASLQQVIATVVEPLLAGLGLSKREKNPRQCEKNGNRLRHDGGV